jgi:tetratricopeptide (TPR) repeat protein
LALIGALKRAPIAFSIALAALTGVAYAPVLRASFLNFDDGTWITANPHVNSGVSFTNIKWAFSSIYASNYVPLTWISHMLDCQFFGLNAGAHHATNLAYHALNVALFFLLLFRVVKSLWPAAIAAALFALHPIHVESVAWVAERKDVLSTLLWLLACHAWFSYAAQPNARRYFLTLILFALGLLAKPMLVTLPFVLLLLDFWPLHRLGRSSRVQASMFGVRCPEFAVLILEKLPFLALSLVACFITFSAQHSSGTMSGFVAYPLNLRLGNAALAYVAYLVKLFAPVGLPVVEPLAPHPLASWPVLGAIVFLCLLTVGPLTQSRRRPWLLVGWLWYLGVLVPVIGIIQVGGQSMAYRYTYIPFMGLSLVLAQFVAEGLERGWLRERIIATAASAGALGLTALTFHQARFWHDNETLYRYSLKHTQRNWMVLDNLGVYLSANHRYDDAIPILQQALAVNPVQYQIASTLGFALEHAGREPEAVRAYQQALELKPQDLSACENLITVLIHSDRASEALPVSDRLLAVDDKRAASWIARGSALLAANRGDAAVTNFDRALALDPSCDRATYYLALAYHKTGQPARARQLLERPLALTEIERLNRFITLGAACRDLRDYQKSADVFRQGLREFPARIELVEPLAQVEYTYLQDYSNALPHLQLMLKLSPNHPQRATYAAAIKYVSKQLSVGTNLISP